ncbi:MAG: dipeptide epimerase, partial [Verrucomicrobia bacterium]|nr:dipeptide epimerase [Verrucomicrobiota bacterium]
MNLKIWTFDLKLAHRWTVASGVESGGKTVSPEIFVRLDSPDGTVGHGEAAPPERYGETPQSVLKFLNRVKAAKLSFADLDASMHYLESLAPGHRSAKAALNLALLDGAARHAGKPVYDHLGLGFTEQRHVTSFSIGIDKPDVIRQKVEAAADFPVLKLKVGGPDDRENLAALRAVAPDKWIRVDANEAWTTKEEALKQIEWLAGDGHVQFIEQPMPAATLPADLRWLKVHSPLPIFADESFHTDHDVPLCQECFHGVNAKLVKTGGITGALHALQVARHAGLQTMIGCMIESSLSISAAAHLAELADYLDLDGNLLI